AVRTFQNDAEQRGIGLWRCRSARHAAREGAFGAHPRELYALHLRPLDDWLGVFGIRGELTQPTLDIGVDAATDTGSEMKEHDFGAFGGILRVARKELGLAHPGGIDSHPGERSGPLEGE